MKNLQVTFTKGSSTIIINCTRIEHKEKITARYKAKKYKLIKN